VMTNFSVGYPPRVQRYQKLFVCQAILAKFY
jgi:hypothetical protein